MKTAIDLAKFEPLAATLAHTKLSVDSKTIQQIERLLGTANGYWGFKAKRVLVADVKLNRTPIKYFHHRIESVLIAFAKLPGGLNGLAAAVAATKNLEKIFDDPVDEYDSDDDVVGVALDVAFIEGRRARPYAQALYAAFLTVYEHQIAHLRDDSMDDWNDFSDESGLSELDSDNNKKYSMRGAFDAVNAIAAAYCALNYR